MPGSPQESLYNSSVDPRLFILVDPGRPLRGSRKKKGRRKKKWRRDVNGSQEGKKKKENLPDVDNPSLLHPSAEACYL